MEGVAVDDGSRAGASVSILIAFPVPAHRIQLVSFPHGAFLLEERRRGMTATIPAPLVRCRRRDPALRQVEDPSSPQRGEAAGGACRVA